MALSWALRGKDRVNQKSRMQHINSNVIKLAEYKLSLFHDPHRLKIEPINPTSINSASNPW
jgi:hypothetical protein